MYVFAADGVNLEANWPAGDPPLVLAAKHSREPALLTRLLSANCDKDARSATGETALHCVVGTWEDPADAVRVLISAGCSANLSDQVRRQLPLHVLARRCAQPKKISHGLVYNIDPNLLSLLHLGICP